MTPLLRSHPPTLAAVDAIASRAIELLDCLHRAETGVVVLPMFWGENDAVADEVDLTLRSADILVRRGLASWGPASKLGPRLVLDGCVYKEEGEDYDAEA